MRLFGSEERMSRIMSLTPDDTPIEAKLLSGVIESSQKRLESVNFERRKNVLSYDDIMNQQRNTIYSQRQEILEEGNMRDKIVGMINETIADEVAYCTSSEHKEDWNFSSVTSNFPFLCTSADEFVYSSDELKKLKADDIVSTLQKRAEERYAFQEQTFGDSMREIERVILLRSIDELWMDHIDYMSELKGSIGLNAYAQRNPLTEYKLVGAEAFDAMINDIRMNTVRAVLSVQPKREIKRESVAVERKASATGPSDGTAKKKPVVKKQNVGRNDPCPCGSGKKYKKCCGAAEGEE